MSSTRKQDTSYALKGVQLYEQGNYEAAIVQYDMGVSLNEPHAMHNRARMHHGGEGGPVNFAEAINLYERIINDSQIEHDNVLYRESLNLRAKMHDNAEGCPVNFAKAIELYEKAVTLDCPAAMYNRALMHEKGNGGPVNLVEANRLYLLAAKSQKSNANKYNYSATGNQLVLNMAISIDTINSCKKISGQLISKQNKLLAHGYHQNDIPEIIIECEKLKYDILKMNVKLFELLSYKHMSSSEAKKLDLIDNKLRFREKADDTQSDLETIASIISSDTLPQALKIIADNLQCVLSYENNKLHYLNAVKQTLSTLKNHLDAAAQRQWPIKWFGRWVNGTPRHINAMQQALARLDCNDTTSLLKTYKIILDTVSSITVNTNRHPTVTQFYNSLKLTLSNVTYTKPSSCLQLDAAAATTPPPTYGTYGYVTTACSANPTTPVYRDLPPSYETACKQSQQSNSATAAAAATQAATSVNNPYNTQYIFGLFPAAPNHPMPSVNSSNAAAGNTTQIRLPCGSTI